MTELSVICPVLDAHPRLLDMAVKSVLRECEAANVSVEIILVDDGSRRAPTLEGLAALEMLDARLRIIRRDTNGGPAAARNQGLSKAQGEWIGFLDADDLWMPGGLNACRALMADQAVAWIQGRHAFLMPAGLTPAPSLPASMRVSPPCVMTGSELTRRLIGNSWVHLGAMLVRRDLALRAGGFAEGLYYSEDVLLAIRLSILTPMHAVDADFYAWRRGGGGLTGSPMRLTDRWLDIYRIASSDPLLARFRREIRWAHYGALKGLAKNKLRAGERWAALRFALRAFLLDPREVREFAHLVALLPRGARADASRYSAAETFVSRAQS